AWLRARRARPYSKPTPRARTTRHRWPPGEPRSRSRLRDEHAKSGAQSARTAFPAPPSDDAASHAGCVERSLVVGEVDFFFVAADVDIVVFVRLRVVVVVLFFGVFLVVLGVDLQLEAKLAQLRLD